MIHQRLSSEASLTSSFSSTQVLFAEQLGRVWEESMGYFLHCLLQNPARVFLYMTPIENESLTTDSILELPVYRINTSRNEVIGLPAPYHRREAVYDRSVDR